MRKFNDYTPNDSSQGDYMEILKSFAGKYEGASQSEIISAILKEAEKGRRNGTLTDTDIDNFVFMLRPMLNSSQQKELDKVVMQIKNIK